MGPVVSERWLVIAYDNGAARIALPQFARFMVGESEGCCVSITRARLAAEHVEVLVDHGVSVRFLADGEISMDGTSTTRVTVGEVYELTAEGYAVFGDAELHVDQGTAARDLPVLSAAAFDRLAEDRPTLRVAPAGEDATTWLAERTNAIAAKLGENGATLLFDDETALTAAANALQADNSRGPLRVERAGAEETGGAGPVRLAYADEGMRHVEELVDRAAAAGANVLIVGETGTGKDMVAQELIRRSGRTEPPIRAAAVALDTPEKLREAVVRARGGVLILDEITGLDVRAQLALAHELDAADNAGAPVRVLSLSSTPLSEAMNADKFRRELAYRLEELEIALPSLRARRAEIAPLAKAFAAERGAAIDPAAIAVLESYAFPGNVRELKNVIGRAHLASGGTIEVKHLPSTVTAAPATPEAVPSAPSLQGDLEEIEKQRIIEAIRVHKTQRDAAAALNMPMTTFLSRMDKYGIPRARKGGRKKSD